MKREDWGEHHERLVEQVKTLFPYLSFEQRLEWVSRLKPLFNHDFAECAKYFMEEN